MKFWKLATLHPSLLLHYRETCSKWKLDLQISPQTNPIASTITYSRSSSSSEPVKRFESRPRDRRDHPAHSSRRSKSYYCAIPVSSSRNMARYITARVNQTVVPACIHGPINTGTRFRADTRGYPAENTRSVGSTRSASARRAFIKAHLYTGVSDARRPPASPVISVDLTFPGSTLVSFSGEAGLHPRRSRCFRVDAT